VVVSIVTMFLLVAAPTALAAPSNDHFAEALDLGGSLPVLTSGDNFGATKETGEEEVALFSAGHSVWFEWEAPSTAFVTIGSCEATFHSVIGVFTGSEVGSLTKVAEGNADEGPHCPNEGREFTFKAVAGTIYKVAVDGMGFYVFGPPPPTEGTFTLRVEATAPSANDDFENAAELVGQVLGQPGGEQIYRASASGYTWGATRQAGEPEHGGDPGGASVWYTWTPPVSGTARITACCGWAPLLGVYSGSAVDALTPVPVGAGVPVNATFAVEAGVEYRIAVDGAFDSGTGEAATGSFDVTVFMQLPFQPVEEGPSSSASPSRQDTKPPRTRLLMHALWRKPPIYVFHFHSSEPGSTFRCQLDKRRFRRCKSPLRLRHLKPGRHVLRVFAVDTAGNRDRSPAVARFRAKRTTARHRPKHRHAARHRR
jgi:hypothetical protein